MKVKKGDIKFIELNTKPDSFGGVRLELGNENYDIKKIEKIIIKDNFVIVEGEDNFMENRIEKRYNMCSYANIRIVRIFNEDEISFYNKEE